MGLFTMNLLCSSSAYPQRSFVSFGAMSDLTLGFKPLGMAAGIPRNGKTELAVLSEEAPEIHFYSLTQQGSFLETSSHHITNNPRVIVRLDSGYNGYTDYGTLASDGESVTIHKRKTTAAIDEKNIVLQSQAQCIEVGDVNNDSRKDLLLFGKNSTGVSTLLCRPDGNYIFGPTLFPEVSVSDLKTVDLNGDGITDILLLNWLSNEMEVFYGIGKMIFSEQVTIELADQPEELAITSVSKQRKLSVAVTLPGSNAISVFNGNSLGEFTPTATIQCGATPSGVKFLDVNGDAYPDIISCTHEGVLVALGTLFTEYSPRVLFGVAANTVSWTITDLDGDGKVDLALVDQSTRRLIALANAGCSHPSQWPSEFAVGSTPYGLAVRDLDGDGLLDIAVANQASSAISILFNKGKGRFIGQQEMKLPEQPLYVKNVASPANAQRTLITSHPATDKVSVIRLADDISRSTVFTLSTGSNPVVLLAKEDTVTGEMDLLVRYMDPRDGAVSLSLFERVAGGKFLERNLRSNLPHKIIALAVDDVTHSGRYDLLFATHDGRSTATTLSIASADSRFHFGSAQSLLSYSDSVSSTRSIITGYVNNDPFKDLVVVLGTPVNALAIAYGNGDGTFRDTLQWIRGIHSFDDDAIILNDADDDGNVDITFIDTRKDSIVVMFRGRDGLYSDPVSVCSAVGVNSIRIGSLRQSHVQDLILSHGSRGTVSVLFSPFKR